MHIFTTHGSVQVADSKIIQRHPGLATFAINPEELGDLFVRHHALGELAHLARHFRKRLATYGLRCRWATCGFDHGWKPAGAEIAAAEHIFSPYINPTCSPVRPSVRRSHARLLVRPLFRMSVCFWPVNSASRRPPVRPPARRLVCPSARSFARGLARPSARTFVRLIVCPLARQFVCAPGPISVRPLSPPPARLSAIPTSVQPRPFFFLFFFVFLFFFFFVFFFFFFFFFVFCFFFFFCFFFCLFSILRSYFLFRLSSRLLFFFLFLPTTTLLLRPLLLLLMFLLILLLFLLPFLLLLLLLLIILLLHLMMMVMMMMMMMMTMLMICR